MKNQPPSFGKLIFIPCRTPWYLNKRTLKVQILQLVWASLFHGTERSGTERNGPVPGTISRNGTGVEWENQRSSLRVHIVKPAGDQQ